MPDQTQRDRADRILDAAGELLLTLGYRKVTIDDIAGRARIGKGTVYLHWRTKGQLFQALIGRESVQLTDEVIGVLAGDAAEVRPHRLLRTLFLATEKRPLIKAVVSADAEVLGELLDSPLGKQDALASAEFFALMRRHGLLRDDVPNLDYTTQAAMSGFFLLDRQPQEAAALDPEARAEGLAHTVRAAFEPAGEPAPEVLAAAAPEVAAAFRRMRDDVDPLIYSHDPR